jgi:hypothetical protein
VPLGSGNLIELLQVSINFILFKNWVIFIQNKTMGFNISGIAINKNYENDFESLQKQFGWNLIKQEEIVFEDASSNWKEEQICDVYFCETGTLIFINMEMCTESWSLTNNNTFTFALSETSMSFCVYYCENGVEKRSIMEFEGERPVDEGEKLAIEEESEDTSEIIWNQMGVVLGKPFWDIEPDEKAVRYIFSNTNQNEVKTNNYKTEQTNATIYTEVKNTDEKKTVKKWWKFWQ